MKLWLVLYCLPFHVRSLHLVERDDFGKPEHGTTSQMGNPSTHQPVPQSQEDAHEFGISWMSQDSRNRLQQVRAHEKNARLNGSFFRTSPRFSLLRDSPTAVVYMTYRGDELHHCQAEQLNSVFGNMFHTVSVRQLSDMPSFLPAGSIGKDLLTMPDDELYKLNNQINKEHGNPSEGSVNLAHALLLPMAIPELKYVWIIEDDVVFDGDNIKQMVDFHSNDDADYMVVELRKYRKHSWWHGWEGLDKLFPIHDWSRSFAPVMRVSTRFVSHVAGEMVGHGFCFFESFFPTVAMHYGMKISKIGYNFTKNVRWMPEWTEEEMSRAKESQAGDLSIFHPFKKDEVHVDSSFHPSKVAVCRL
jgi:hypothetical protein